MKLVIKALGAVAKVPALKLKKPKAAKAPMSAKSPPSTMGTPARVEKNPAAQRERVGQPAPVVPPKLHLAKADVVMDKPDRIKFTSGHTLDHENGSVTLWGKGGKLVSTGITEKRNGGYTAMLVHGHVAHVDDNGFATLYDKKGKVLGTSIKKSNAMEGAISSGGNRLTQIPSMKLILDMDPHSDHHGHGYWTGKYDTTKEQDQYVVTEQDGGRPMLNVDHYYDEAPPEDEDQTIKSLVIKAKAKFIVYKPKKTKEPEPESEPLVHEHFGVGARVHPEIPGGRSSPRYVGTVVHVSDRDTRYSPSARRVHVRWDTPDATRPHEYNTDSLNDCTPSHRIARGSDKQNPPPDGTPISGDDVKKGSRRADDVPRELRKLEPKILRKLHGRPPRRAKIVFNTSGRGGGHPAIVIRTKARMPRLGHGMKIRTRRSQHRK